MKLLGGKSGGALEGWSHGAEFKAARGPSPASSCRGTVRLQRLAQPADALFDFRHIGRGKAQPQRGEVGVGGVKRRAGHKGHELLDRFLGEFAGVSGLAARARQPGPEEQAALRLRELDRVAQLALAAPRPWRRRARP